MDVTADKVGCVTQCANSAACKKKINNLDAFDEHNKTDYHAKEGWVIYTYPTGGAGAKAPVRDGLASTALIL
jgi:hypothetical protein